MKTSYQRRKEEIQDLKKQIKDLKRELLAKGNAFFTTNK